MTTANSNDEHWGFKSSTKNHEKLKKLSGFQTVKIFKHEIKNLTE